MSEHGQDSLTRRMVIIPKLAYVCYAAGILAVYLIMYGPTFFWRLLEFLGLGQHLDMIRHMLLGFFRAAYKS